MLPAAQSTSAAKHMGKQQMCCKAQGMLQSTGCAAKHRGCCKAHRGAAKHMGLLQGTFNTVACLWVCACMCNCGVLNHMTNCFLI